MSRLTVIAGLLFFPLLVYANNLLLYGLELSEDNSYLYFGSVLPFSYDESDYMFRIWTAGAQYEYDSNPVIIDAIYKHVSLSIGRHYIYDAGWQSIYIGYNYSDTSLDPDDLSNELRGSNQNPVLSIDGVLNINSCDFEINYGLNYIFGRDAYWARVRPVCWDYRSSNMGFEIISHGDKNYHHVQLGALLYNMSLSNRTDYTLKAGMSRTQDSKTYPYIGVEFTTRY